MFFCPDGITPNSGLTGPNNTMYVCMYVYIYISINISMMYKHLTQQKQRQHKLIYTCKKI